MNILKNKNFRKIETYLFFAYWILMNGVKAVGLAEGQRLYNIGIALAFGCVITKILFEFYEDFFVNKFDFKTLLCWASIAAIYIIGTIIYVISNQWSPLLYISLVCGLRNINIQEVFRSGVCLWSFCFIIKALLALCGIREGFVLVHEKLGLGPLIRHSFDYTHPNVLQITYGFIMFGILYLNGQKGRKLIRTITIMMIGSIFVFFYSLSYTGLFMNLMGYIIYIYAVNRKRLMIGDKMLAYGGFLCWPIIAVGIPLLTFDGLILRPYLAQINDFFHGRILMSRQALLGGIHIWGTPVSLSGVLGALDSSYIQLFTFQGVVFFCIVMLISIWTLSRCLSNDDRRGVAIILAMAIGGFTEPYLFNTSFKNWIFVIAGMEIWKTFRKNDDLEPYQTENNLMYIFCDWIRKTKVKTVDFIHKNVSVFGALVVGISIITTACRIGMYKPPAEIYVLMSHTDVEDKEELYISENEYNNLEQSGVKIYDYYGQDKPMYKFDGEIVRVEVIRTYIGYAVSCFVMSSMVVTGAFSYCSKKKCSGKNRI